MATTKSAAKGSSKTEVKIGISDSTHEINFECSSSQSEVNLEELYEGCCLIDELDEYLKSFGFERKITKLWDDGAVGWGDALYIKND